MSRKFDHPIETYQIGRIRPIAIELDRAGLGKYRRLASNPIYYYNALLFTGGALYRATLGYEILWDQKAEKNLMLCLDYFLTDLVDKGTYYLEEVKVLRDTKLHGIAWPRGIAPRTINFNLQWAYEIKAGESLTCRVNLLDKPNHVDIERANGDVFTIQFLRYQNYFRETFKRKGTPNEKQKYKPYADRIPTSETKGLRMVRGFGKENPARSLSGRLHDLRQRWRRQSPL